ncbi:MAG: hypothetical protein WEB60_06540 [Terrimicrobiaceae bacterium]
MERYGHDKSRVNPQTIGLGVCSALTVKESSLVEKARAVEMALEELLDSARACAAKTEHDFAAIRLLSREQAAELLNLSLSQLDRLTKRGSIPTVWIDRRPRYPLCQLGEWISAHTTIPISGAPSSFTANKKMMRTFSKIHGGEGE